MLLLKCIVSPTVSSRTRGQPKLRRFSLDCSTDRLSTPRVRSWETNSVCYNLLRLFVRVGS